MVIFGCLLERKKNNIGYLSFKKHRNFKEPKSIYITRRNGKYWVSFCFENDNIMEVQSKKETLKYLKGCDLEYLEKHTIGIDRGVAIPIQAGNQSFDFSQTQKKKQN